MLPFIIALSILALHIFLCFRKHWIWGGFVPALTLALMIASPFVFENTTFGESVKVFGILEILLLLGWIFCRESIKKQGQRKLNIEQMMRKEGQRCQGLKYAET